MSYVIGIDTSTTATKAILVDESGRVVAIGVAEYDAQTPRPLWSEQDPGVWWSATIDAVHRAISDVDAAEVVAVGLTGQMHGLVMLDHNDDIVRPAILWNDQRTAAECNEMRERVGRRRLIQITGNDALTGFTAPKLLWVRNNEPDAYRRATSILLPKDYVRLKLTGLHATDRAGGGGTQLFDLAARTWSEELLADLDIDPQLLPPTFEGTSITGRVTDEAADATGLAPGTPVVAGGGDQAASAVGTGAIEPGIVTVSLGTSGVVFAATSEPSFEPEGRVHAFPHAIPERWHMMGVMLSAAGSYRWYRDAFADGVDFGELDDEAATAPPGSNGLLFLPYLSGERSPHPDPNARGAFVGLTVRHRSADLTRSVLEGVAFGLADILDLMVEAGIDRPASVRISGGGAKSELWRQIIAETLGATVETVNTIEGAAYGAAMLASIGGGWFDDARSAIGSWVSVNDSVEPGAASAQYSELHSLYSGLYEALKPTFSALAPTAP
ncbi:MAG: xylulokinase [Acidimicrobiia bacterium]|nr:xylulokinase [Acidimicrobiia bacterium]